MSIPKKIHYCWFGGGEKSELIKKCIESWKQYAPECEIIEWNETNYDVSKNTYMYEAYKAKRWGFVPDYARLDIIYQHGGIYLDTDVELIKPIGDLLNGDGFCGFEQADKNAEFSVNTGSGFGAKINDPVIFAMREIYNGLSFYNEDGTQNLQPSPYYNTKVLQEHGLKCDNSLQKIGEITVYPYEYFCPVNWKTHECKTTTNTYSIHHFDASWLSKQEKAKRLRQRRLDWVLHMPNRIGRRILGDESYDRLKKYIKKKDHC